MKKLTIIISVFLLLFSIQSHARDTKLMLSIQEGMATSSAKEKLNPAVKMYFGKNSGYGKEIGTYVSNRKTNAFNKSDKKACEWAFLSALISLQERAIAEGGNAVTNIHSYYKKNEYYSATQYECHAGGVIAGVALKGTVVKQ